MLSAATRQRARERATVISDEIVAVPNDEWRGLGGLSGDVILHWAALHATGDPRYERALHASLQRAARSDGFAVGLYVGISGVRAAAALAKDFEPRYERLVQQCDERIEAAIPEQFERPPSFHVFDIIGGWAGVRLARCVRGPRDADRFTEALAWLIGDWDRWKCPHPEDEDEIPVHDMGLAHGVAGMLSAIALTVNERFERDVVLKCAQQLLDSKRGGRDFAVWPHSLEHDDVDELRSAWCYGTCGVTASLHAVARTYDAPAIVREAEEIALACARAGRSRWRINELGLCHGLMGNALCFASIAAHAADDRLKGEIDALVAHVLDILDENGGICWSHKDGQRFAATSELLGTAGIALALFTLCGDAPSDWMRLHGLQPL